MNTNNILDSEISAARALSAVFGPAVVLHAIDNNYQRTAALVIDTARVAGEIRRGGGVYESVDALFVAAAHLLSDRIGGGANLTPYVDSLVAGNTP